MDPTEEELRRSNPGLFQDPVGNDLYAPPSPEERNEWNTMRQMLQAPADVPKTEHNFGEDEAMVIGGAAPVKMPNVGENPQEGIDLFAPPSEEERLSFQESMRPSSGSGWKFNELHSAIAGGIQGLTGDFGDELASYPLGAMKSVAGGDFETNRRQVRDFLRQRIAEAKQQNPASYFVGGMAGSALPLGRAAKAISGAGRAGQIALGALAGGISGIGQSEKEGKDSIPDAVGPALLSGGIAAGFAAPGAALGTVRNLRSKFHKYDTSRVPDRFLQRPKQVLDADLEKPAVQAGNTAASLHKASTADKGKAVEELADVEFKGGKEIYNILDRHEKSYQGDKVHLLPGERRTLRKIRAYKKLYRPRVTAEGHRVYPHVPAERVVKLISALSDEIDFDAARAAGKMPADKVPLTQLRHELRQLLRERGGEKYRNLMDDSARKKSIAKELGKPPVNAGDYGKYEGKIRKGGMREYARESLERVDEVAGTNLSDSAQDYAAKEQLRRQINRARERRKGKVEKTVKGAAKLVTSPVRVPAKMAAGVYRTLTNTHRKDVPRTQFPTADSLSGKDLKEVMNFLTPNQRNQVRAAMKSDPKKATKLLQSFLKGTFAPEKIGVNASRLLGEE